jgi:hypothetical protein
MTHHAGSDQHSTQGGFGGRCCPGPEGAVRKRYDVTIKGEPGEMLLAAFSDMTVRQAPGVTVLSADLDQAALHGLLARVADLGLELMGVSLGADSGQPRRSDWP